jgi:hypothetical protein
MKTRFSWLIVVVLAVCLCVWAIWAKFALIRARQARIIALQADFLASFTTAQTLRTGNVQQALSRIEDHTYATALQLLDLRGNTSVVMKMLTPDLRAYRSKYAYDTSSWSIVEKRLEELLHSHDEPRNDSPQ